MTTEQDIKQFFETAKPQVSDSDKFMADLMRQIDLLPVPATLCRADENALREQLYQLKKLKKNLRKKAFATIFASLLIAVIICITVTQIIVVSSLISWLIISILLSAIFLLSCIQADFFRID